MINFKDYENMVRKIARQKAKQFPSIEYDELVGRGALLFVETLGRWNPEKSQFGQPILLSLRRRLPALSFGPAALSKISSGAEKMIRMISCASSDMRDSESLNSYCLAGSQPPATPRTVSSKPSCGM